MTMILMMMMMMMMLIIIIIIIITPISKILMIISKIKGIFLEHIF